MSSGPSHSSCFLSSVWLAILLAFWSTGCATTYNPLGPSAWGNENEIIKACKAADNYDYRKGVDCAQRVRSAYLDKAASEAAFADLIAILLIPTVASVIGIGVAEVGTKTITGVSLGAAAGYGIGTWLVSKPRQEIYALGAQALSCVITASAPLNVPKEITEQITRARGNLETALATLDRQLNSAGIPPPVLEKARKVKADAEEVLRTADSTITVIKQAGATIWNAVMEVDAQVVAAQLKQARDLKDLSDHLQTTVYGTYQDILGLATRPEKVIDADQELAAERKTAVPEAFNIQADTAGDPTKDLQDAADAVTTAALALGRSVQSVNITGLNQQFAACLNPLKAVQARVQLRISPSSVVRLAPNSSARVVVSGGQAPYTAVPLWPSGTDLTVEGPPTSGPATIDIKAGAQLVAASYFLSIHDSSGAEKLIRVEVRSATAQRPDTTPPTVPANLSATVGTAQVNLTWTASTDNVGVTGYRVERCQGVGCTNFVEIAAPTRTSHNDTGLSSGTYSYRVRATNAARNLSGYSNTATASVTQP